MNNPLDVLERFEYDSEGNIKRYPPEAEYNDAMEKLSDLLGDHADLNETVCISRHNFRILWGAYRDSRPPKTPLIDAISD